MATFKTGYSFDTKKLTKDIKEGKFKDKEPSKFIFETNKRGRKVKKINPRWTAWSKKQKNKTNKTENNTTKTKSKPTFKQSIKAGEELNKTVKASDKKPKYKQVTQEELDKKLAEKKKTNTKLKISPYRRTKGEGIAKKGGGYRGDTRITKKLKKAGFTETRLARLRKKNAEFQAAKKDKKKMKAYREKYGK
jgi:hypothetical protein